jgi:hypothetical protein
LKLPNQVRVNKSSESTEIEITYSPIGFGKLRLFIQFANALGSMHVSSDEQAQLFIFLNILKTGTDVMITIFCKKIGVFLKNQCYDQIFISFAFSQTRQFFRRIFWRKYFKK